MFPDDVMERGSLGRYIYVYIKSTTIGSTTGDWRSESKSEPLMGKFDVGARMRPKSSKQTSPNVISSNPNHSHRNKKQRDSISSSPSRRSPSKKKGGVGSSINKTFSMGSFSTIGTAKTQGLGTIRSDKDRKKNTGISHI